MGSGRFGSESCLCHFLAMNLQQAISLLCVSDSSPLKGVKNPYSIMENRCKNTCEANLA